MHARKFDLGAAFEAKQRLMLAALGVMPQLTSHPGTKGSATEGQWRAMLRDFLPERYGVGEAFIIDSVGNQSQQIDLAIFDRQYSPLVFEDDGINFIPVESVYAVCEVKQQMNRANLNYAREKIASVRALRRTSAPIVHAGGQYPPADPDEKPILRVFLSTDLAWQRMDSKAALTAIMEDDPTALDLGIAVRGGAFDRSSEVVFAPPSQELIWFTGRLFRALRALGTVLAIDFDAYYAEIENRRKLLARVGQGLELYPFTVPMSEAESILVLSIGTPVRHWGRAN